jgi:hypothetical protein
VVSDWSTALRTELAERAAVHMTKIGAPGYLSLGSAPTRLFETYDDGQRHGNFIHASYQAICDEPPWKARTHKAHSQMQALPLDKRLGARELDSCNSSDALLMNCFCYPGAAERIIAALLPSVSYTTPQFGIHGEVALVGALSDGTEIDMQIGAAIFEAKLTERDFTTRPKSTVEKYARFSEVFDTGALPQSSHEYHGYQLIRNILAAEQHNWAFYLICDSRRPDLLHDWWAVHSAIRDVTLRTRVGFLLWQEIARVCPLPLKAFLAEKYGIGMIIADGHSKGVRYRNLVRARKACRACDGLTNPSVCHDGVFDCDEMGAWSQWQGNLDTELMVIGQDWGDVAWFVRERGGSTNTSKTNTTLVEWWEGRRRL